MPMRAHRDLASGQKDWTAITLQAKCKVLVVLAATLASSRATCRYSSLRSILRAFKLCASLDGSPHRMLQDTFWRGQRELVWLRLCSLALLWMMKDCESLSSAELLNTSIAQLKKIELRFHRTPHRSKGGVWISKSARMSSSS